jgi:hypothetical protein
MPITESQGTFSTGRDCSIVLIGPFGRVDLQNVTGFDATQMTATIKVDRLDGVQMNAELPKGWSGSMDVDRGNNALDLLMAQEEVNWFDNGVYANSTMFQYVTEQGGAVTTFAYDNVALKLDAGRWSPDASVKQKLTFTANRRRVV